jgi:hypothetical protein
MGLTYSIDNGLYTSLQNGTLAPLLPPLNSFKYIKVALQILFKKNWTERKEKYFLQASALILQCDERLSR